MKASQKDCNWFENKLADIKYAVDGTLTCWSDAGVCRSLSSVSMLLSLSSSKMPCEDLGRLELRLSLATAVVLFVSKPHVSWLCRILGVTVKRHSSQRLQLPTYGMPACQQWRLSQICIRKKHGEQSNSSIITTIATVLLTFFELAYTLTGNGVALHGRMVKTWCYSCETACTHG